MEYFDGEISNVSYWNTDKPFEGADKLFEKYNKTHSKLGIFYRFYYWLFPRMSPDYGFPLIKYFPLIGIN